MQHLRISSPRRDLTDEVMAVFSGDPAVSHLSVMRGASVEPAGDIVQADVAREATNEVIDGLDALGVPEEGTVHVEPVTTWLLAWPRCRTTAPPGRSADAVVWADVTQRAYEEAELNWTYLAFMRIATLIAGIAIVLDSQVLVIGAMVLGPEFIPVAALGLALVRGRSALFSHGPQPVRRLCRRHRLTATAVIAGASLGWIVNQDVTGERPGTDFIYSPDKWSFIVALIAGAAGVLHWPSAKVGGLPGVFISVTTVPAAGNVALGIAFAAWDEVTGSAIRFALNISGMHLVGWATLALQHLVWNRKAHHRQRLLARDKP